MSLLDIILEALTNAMRRKEIKAIWIGKEEIKLFLFTDDVIVYIENSKESKTKLLQPISNNSKVAGYKVIIAKVNCFLIY